MLWLPVQVVKVQKPPEIKATKVLRTKDLRVDLDVVMRKMASCEYLVVLCKSFGESQQKISI